MPIFKPSRGKSGQGRSRAKAPHPSKWEGQNTEVTIQGVSHEGHGVSRDLGKVLFVPGALMNEKVSVQITKEQRNRLSGRLLDVLEPSTHRVPPQCPHFQRCGACQLQHLDTPQQISDKQQHLHEDLVRHLKLTELPWLPPIHSEAFGYRRRARLGIRYRQHQDEVIVGFREEANSHLAAIDTCDVLRPELSALIQPLQALLSQLDGRSRFTQAELIADDDGPVMVLRYLKTLNERDEHQLVEFAQQQNLCLWLQPDEVDGLRCIWPESARPLQYALASLRLEFQVKDFIQGNGSVNRAMVERAIEWLAPQSNETVLDLFAGIGNFSLPIAQQCHQVIAVEGVAGMVARIKHNAELNDIKNIEAIKLNLDDPINMARLPKVDRIILDPPRTGAASMMPWLIQQQASILYIACEPSSLVRDAKPLLDAGYTLSKLCVMDMFPQTRHVETMALFERN